MGDGANLPRALPPGPPMCLQGRSGVSPSAPSSDVSLFTLCGVCMCVRVRQQAGIYWVTLIDQFVASWVLLFLTLFEIIGICYIYGTSDFLEMLAARAAAMTGSCLCRRQPVH